MSAGRCAAWARSGKMPSRTVATIVESLKIRISSKAPPWCLFTHSDSQIFPHPKITVTIWKDAEAHGGNDFYRYEASHAIHAPGQADASIRSAPSADGPSTCDSRSHVLLRFRQGERTQAGSQMDCASISTGGLRECRVKAGAGGRCRRASNHSEAAHSRH